MNRTGNAASTHPSDNEQAHVHRMGKSVTVDTRTPVVSYRSTPESEDETLHAQVSETEALQEQVARLRKRNEALKKENAELKDKVVLLDGVSCRQERKSRCVENILEETIRILHVDDAAGILEHLAQRVKSGLDPLVRKISDLAQLLKVPTEHLPPLKELDWIILEVKAIVGDVSSMAKDFPQGGKSCSPKEKANWLVRHLRSKEEVIHDLGRQIKNAEKEKERVEAEIEKARGIAIFIRQSYGMTEVLESQRLVSVMESLQSETARAAKHFTKVSQKLGVYRDKESVGSLAKRTLESVDDFLKDRSDALGKVQKLETQFSKAPSVRSEITPLETENAEQRGKIEKQQHRLERLKKQQQETEAMAQEERTRYNNLLALRIRQDTRNFQDLNDKGRPEAVAKKFQDICNCERLDAADELDKDFDMEDAKGLEVLCDVMTVSHHAALRIVQVAEKDIRNVLALHDSSFTLGEGLKLEIRHDLKLSSKDLCVSKIQQETTENIRQKYEGFAKLSGEVEKFVTACAEVAWMIVLTSPPMALVTDTGVTFDPKYHTLYAECRAEKGAVTVVSRYLWPGLRFQGDDLPQKKGIVFVDPPVSSADMDNPRPDA